MSNFVHSPHGYPLSHGHRICVHKDRGGRDYMEDMPVFARDRYNGVPDDIVTVPYDYIAIFDGHGGIQAAEYASEHLLRDIISQREFWSGTDTEVLSAIRQGFIDCHYNMWKVSKDWPPRPSGRECTAGTTASVAFIRGDKVYVGHAGDSGIALGKMNEAGHTAMKASPEDLSEATVSIKTSEATSQQKSHFEAVMLTRDHKPENPDERKRIESLNGEVRRGNGGDFRVVWKRRPLNSETVPADITLPVTLEHLPYLNIARSLGDFWSYEEEHKEFVVSPVPDVAVHCFSMPKQRCLIAGSDGLWTVVRATECVQIVEETYRLQEMWAWQCLKAGKREQIHAVDVNVAELLVRKALNRCELRRTRSDNVGVVVYYPCVSEEKILRLLENPAEGSMFPWINDSDQGIAQYRHSLMNLQNMVSCINSDSTNLSVMEIACRMDMIGYPPRMRCNPLREQFPDQPDIREAVFDIDQFIPQCALVITRGKENLRIPAYDSLILEEGFMRNESDVRINPLNKGCWDMLLSQRIENFQTRSSPVIESSTTTERTELTVNSANINGIERLCLTPAPEEEEKVDSAATFFFGPSSREELDGSGKVFDCQKDG